MWFKWRQLARRFGVGIFIEHPIDSPADLRTLESFVSAGQQTLGLIYYAPRPNDYQETNSATLFAANPMRSTGIELGGLLRQTLSRAFERIQVCIASIRNEVQRVETKYCIVISERRLAPKTSIEWSFVAWKLASLES